MKAKLYDPYAELIDIFNRKGIKYVVVGMSGINYYATNASDTVMTQDFDIFVKPTIANIKKAASILKRLGYNLFANAKELSDTSFVDIVKQKKTILATNPQGIVFELILGVSGYTFSQMEEDAVIFDVDKIPAKVGRLKKLLMSKKLAARPKDKLFLKRYEILLKEKDKK